MPSIKTVTRRRLLKAFSTPNRTHSEVKKIVNLYMGSNTIPPVWSVSSLKGVFGVRVTREWSRHIKQLTPATIYDKNHGEIFTITQTAYDFGVTPELLAIWSLNSTVEIPKHSDDAISFLDVQFLHPAANEILCYT